MSTLRSPFWFDNVDARPAPRPGLTWWTTNIYVPDVEAACSLYANVFAMVRIFDMPGQDDRLQFARLRYRGINITLSAEGSFGHVGVSPARSGQTAPFIFYLYVDQVERMHRSALASGFVELQAPQEQFWGDLSARIRDPFGYVWDIAEVVHLDGTSP